MSFRHLIFIFLFVIFNSFVEIQGNNVDDDVLTIHIIPHSHCDPGWLRTFHEYYGEKVRSILNGITSQLISNPQKTFIWAEISFFKLWWDEQSVEKKEEVKKLVENGQLEFVGGGWVQNDEAAVNFDQIVRQITEGHEFLMKTFNDRPRIAWQVDPFGHSSLTPTLFAQIGYEALVINRIHYSLKASYKGSRSMEFIWRASPSFGTKAEMFTHVLHTHYAAPIGYDWEEGNSESVNGQNVGRLAEGLINVAKSRAEAYRTKHLMVPWGDDFKFQNADWQYSNMDQLIEKINSNSHSGVKIQYSTLSRYFDSVRDYAKRSPSVKFPLFHGDFYPYADNEDSYWTGYYSTRPTLKGLVRKADNSLRSAEVMYALARSASYDDDVTNVMPWDNIFHDLQTCRWDTALITHHDGVTGTSRSYVTDSYHNTLSSVVARAENAIKRSVSILLGKNTIPDLESTTYDDILQVSQDTSIALIFHNSLGWARKQLVTIRVNSKEVQITDSTGLPVSSEIFPVWKGDANGIKEEPEKDHFKLHFFVEVGPLGLNTYFLSHNTRNSAKVASYTVYSKNSQGKAKSLGSESISIENSLLKIKFDDEGTVTSVYDKETSQTRDLSIKYFNYQTSRSGAYIFRSEALAAHPLDHGDFGPRIHVIKGDMVQEVQVISMNKITQKIRLDVGTTQPTSAKIIQVLHNVQAGSDREVIVRYKTGLKVEEQFFTDNGLEIRHRVREAKKVR